MALTKKRLSYIYSITNKETGRVYIGSTNRQLKVRWLEHQKRLRHDDHLNPELQADYNALGGGGNALRFFIFHLVETVEPEVVEEREQFWRDEYAKKPAGVYNTGTDTATPFKNRTHSEATKEAIRQKVKATIAGKKIQEKEDLRNEIIRELGIQDLLPEESHRGTELK